MDSRVKLQLSDFLESYEEIGPGFQTYISSKKEFFQLASSAKEEPIKRGNLFKHQELFKRYMYAYPALLVMDETGTGKSCSFVGFTEYLYEQMNRPFNRGYILNQYKHVYVLVSGETQENEFHKQLICRCTPEERFEITPKGRIGSLSEAKRLIKKSWYSVLTFVEFTHMVMEFKGDLRAIEEEFSDCIFWIDEGHNLNVETEERGRKEKLKITKVEKYNAIYQVLRTAKRTKRVITTATPMINHPRELKPLMDLISDNDDFPEDALVLTPEQEEELDSIEDEREAHDQKIEFITQNLEPYFRGKITYTRVLDNNVIIKEQGELKSNEETVSGVVVEELAMVPGGPQAEVFDREFPGAEFIGEEFGTKLDAISYMVFPDGSYGSKISIEEKIRKAYEKYHKEHPDVDYDEYIEIHEEEHPEDIDKNIGQWVELRKDRYVATTKFKNWLRNNGIEGLRSLSCKYAWILEKVRAVVQDPEAGCIFIYGRLVKGSGLNTLVMLMDLMDLVFNDSSLKFDEYYHEQAPFRVGEEEYYCEPPNIGSIDPIIDSERHANSGSWTFAYFNDKVAKNKFGESMKSAVNSKENVHGDIIKVFIATTVAKEGININNMTEIINIEPAWNRAKEYQAVSRAIRTNSHDYLLEEKRRRLRQKDVTIDVNLYRLSAVSSGRSFDTQKYLIAERKNVNIKMVERAMKKTSIGCWVNYIRNTRMYWDKKIEDWATNDEEYSPVCDYSKCLYQCFDASAEGMAPDYTTFDVLYAEQEIKIITTHLRKIYRKNNAYSLDDIFLNLDDYIKAVPSADNPYLPKEQYKIRMKHVIIALSNLINNKIPIQDRYGFNYFLHEDGGIFYLGRNFASSELDDYLNSYYTKNLILTQEKSLGELVTTTLNIEDLLSSTEEKLKDVLESLELNYDKEGINELLAEYQMDSDVSQFLLDYYQSELKNNALLFENAINNRVNGQETTFDHFAIRANLCHWFRIPIQEKLIKLDLENINEKEVKKETENSTTIDIWSNKPPGLDDEWKDKLILRSGNVAYIHSILVSKNLKSDSGVVARDKTFGGLLRILIPSERIGWRNLKQEELRPYRYYLQKMIKRNDETREQELRDLSEENGGEMGEDETPVYGFMRYGVFYIVDSTKKGKGRKEEAKGKKASTFQLGPLNEIIEKLVRMYNIEIEEDYEGYKQPDLRDLVYRMMLGAGLIECINED